MCHCSSPTAIRPPGHADPPSTLSLRGPIYYDIVRAGSPVCSSTCRPACPSSVRLSVFVCPPLCLSVLSFGPSLCLCPPLCLSVLSVFCLSFGLDYPSLCLSVLSVCLSVCLSFGLDFPSVCPIFQSCLSVFRSCLSVRLSFSLVCLSFGLDCPSVCLSFSLVCLSFGLVCPSVCLSVLSVRQSVFRS